MKSLTKCERLYVVKFSYWTFRQILQIFNPMQVIRPVFHFLQAALGHATSDLETRGAYEVWLRINSREIMGQ